MNDVLQVLANQMDTLAEARIKTAPYDTTYDGVITNIKFNNDTKPTDRNYNMYTVKFNTVERDFVINDGSSHIVGEIVRVHIPQNAMEKRYVETISNSSVPASIIYDDEKDTITVCCLNGQQRKYTLTVNNKGEENEEVTAMTFPDGSVVSLVGF